MACFPLGFFFVFAVGFVIACLRKKCKLSQMLKRSKCSCLSTANPVKPYNYTQCTSHKRVRSSRKTADESTSHSKKPFAQKTIRSLFG